MFLIMPLLLLQCFQKLLRLFPTRTMLFDKRVDGGRVAAGVDGVDATDERRNAAFPLFGVDAVASHDAASFRFRPP